MYKYRRKLKFERAGAEVLRAERSNSERARKRLGSCGSIQGGESRGLAEFVDSGNCGLGGRVPRRGGEEDRRRRKYGAIKGRRKKT